MTSAAERECGVFALGDVALQSGRALRDAELASGTGGRLNAARDHCVVFATDYTGDHGSNARMIGGGLRALLATLAG
jgi:homoserine acetyltransferase